MNNDAALLLVRDAKRSQSLSTLVPYREELVKNLLLETKYLTQGFSISLIY
jgi:hypothetical protein